MEILSARLTIFVFQHLHRDRQKNRSLNHRQEIPSSLQLTWIFNHQGRKALVSRLSVNLVFLLLLHLFPSRRDRWQPRLFSTSRWKIDRPRNYCFSFCFVFVSLVRLLLSLEEERRRQPILEQLSEKITDFLCFSRQGLGDEEYWKVFDVRESLISPCGSSLIRRRRRKRTRGGGRGLNDEFLFDHSSFSEGKNCDFALWWSAANRDDKQIDRCSTEEWLVVLPRTFPLRRPRREKDGEDFFEELNVFVEWIVRSNSNDGIIRSCYWIEQRTTMPDRGGGGRISSVNDFSLRSSVCSIFRVFD